MSARLSAFLVDDEPLALRGLARLLRATGRVEIVGTALEPEKALELLAAQPVDVLFLDIRMPRMSGFDLLKRLPPGPLVVFTTGYDEYAVQAFRVAAVDYLLKPIERELLEQALDRVEQRLGDAAAGGEVRRALELLAASLRSGPPRGLDRLPVQERGRTRFLELARVTHFVVKDGLTRAVTAEGEHLVEAPLDELERKLDPAKFVRIHRGVLLNLDWVGEVHSSLAGGLLVRLKDRERTELPVARARVPEVKERLGL